MKYIAALGRIANVVAITLMSGGKLQVSKFEEDEEIPMTTLFDATLALARKLGVLRISSATGGSTTTVVDTARNEGDGSFNGGTVWIITALLAAPENEFARISDWDSATHTFTIDAVSDAVETGDRYGFTASRYPLDVLLNAINATLTKYKYLMVDTTSLDAVTGQSEYDLPSGINTRNLSGVWEATNSQADNNLWTPLSWSVFGAEPGTQHKLIIHSKMSAGNAIMLLYTKTHAALYDADEIISPAIPLELLLPEAARLCEVIRMRTYGSGSKLDVEMLNMYKREAIEAEMRFPMRYPAKQGRVNEAQ